MLLLRLRLRGGGKIFIKCKKCGGERKKYTPCMSPCEFGKGWVEPTKAEKDKAWRVFMEERAKEKVEQQEGVMEAKKWTREDRDKRTKDRADARMLAQAKAKKPKIMRELEV